VSLSVSYDPSTTALLPDYLDNTRVEEQEKTVAGMWATCITRTTDLCKVHHIQDHPCFTSSSILIHAVVTDIERIIAPLDVEYQIDEVRICRRQLFDCVVIGSSNRHIQP